MTQINPKWGNLVSSFCRFTQGDGELQLHAGEVLPAHPPAVQQQRKARSLGERTAKGRGHPPGVHHAVSHPGLRLILGCVLILLLGVGDATSGSNTHALMDELFFSAHRSQGEKEMQGIIVSYKVKVNLMVSSGG